jgi:hypothetical protein
LVAHCGEWTTSVFHFVQKVLFIFICNELNSFSLRFKKGFLGGSFSFSHRRAGNKKNQKEKCPLSSCSIILKLK